MRGGRRRERERERERRVYLPPPRLREHHRLRVARVLMDLIGKKF